LEDNCNFFFSNAGHHPPIFFGNNSVHELSRGGLIMGPYADAKYERGFVFFEKGNVLVMYTDGVTEATNRKGEEFGTERLIQIVQNNRNDSSQSLCEKIFSSVEEFTESDPPRDDRTVFVVRKD
jgi:sigma-B regulation protein RsbU (phosphoserine phosphatase)